MNIFNRIIMIIAMLCLIVFSIVAIVNIFVDLFDWATVTNRTINYVTSLNQYLFAAILFLVLAIALIILIFELYKRKIKHANISADQSGKAMVTLKTSAQQIRESLSGIQGIVEPKVIVIPKQNGIIIDIFSNLVKGVNVVDKARELRETASNFASKNLGFKVLQTNYTVTGFINKKFQDTRAVRQQAQAEIKQREQEVQQMPKDLQVQENQEIQLENKSE